MFDQFRPKFFNPSCIFMVPFLGLATLPALPAIAGGSEPTQNTQPVGEPAQADANGQNQSTQTNQPLTPQPPTNANSIGVIQQNNQSQNFANPNLPTQNTQNIFGTLSNNCGISLGANGGIVTSPNGSNSSEVRFGVLWNPTNPCINTQKIEEIRQKAETERLRLATEGALKTQTIKSAEITITACINARRDAIVGSFDPDRVCILPTTLPTIQTVTLP